MKTQMQERLQKITLAAREKLWEEFQHKYDGFVDSEAARLHKECLAEAEKAAGRGLTEAVVTTNYRLSDQEIEEGVYPDYPYLQYLEDWRQLHLLAKRHGLKDVSLRDTDAYVNVRTKMTPVMDETWGDGWKFTWTSEHGVQIRLSWL